MLIGCCSQSKSLSDTLGQCTWTDCGASCPSGTTQLTQTLTGDGGDQPCTSGRRSLCCPTSGGSSFIPDTCGWYQNAYHNTCTPGCPQGKVQLAVDSAGASCVRGFGSFCCDPPVNSLEGRDSEQVKDFYHTVESFLTSGTCHKDGGNKIPRKKRQVISSIIDSFAMSLKLSPLLYTWGRQKDSRGYVIPFAQVWDDENTAHGNMYPKFDVLSDAMLAYNPIDGDSISFLENVLCNGKYSDGISDDAATSNYLCTAIPGQGFARRDVLAAANETEEQHSKRMFFDRWGAGDSAFIEKPTLGDAIENIVSGAMRPEYFKWFRYQGSQIELEGNETPLDSQTKIVPRADLFAYRAAVFLLGSDTNTPASFMRDFSWDNFAVVHIHLNAGGLINGRLAIDQINIRHAGSILQRESTPIPGQYTTGTDEATGQPVFQCPVAAGMDPATPLAGTTRRVQLVTQLVQLISGWGENHDLFNQNNPDPSTYWRVERGPRTGNFKKGPPPDRAPRVPMFTGPAFTQGNGGIAFAPDGSLYDPHTSHGGDIVNTPGFYTS